MNPPPLWMRTGCDPVAMATRARALVAEAYCVTEQEMIRRDRSFRVAWARHVYLWLMWHTGLTRGAVSRVVGRDRACSNNSQRAVENARECYPDVRAETDALLAKFNTKP